VKAVTECRPSRARRFRNGVASFFARPFARPSTRPITLVLSGAFYLGLSACAEPAKLDVQAGTGRNPVLPTPQTSLIPTVNIAPAQGWATAASPTLPVSPTAAPGLQVQAFARELNHPRWLCVLPNGDVLVAETNAPPRPKDVAGIKGWVMRKVMTRAGAGVASANRVTLLRDTDGDGVADLRTVLLSGLNSPFGMALVGDELFVANSDAVLRFAYTTGSTRITSAGRPVVALPAGEINHHWTKNIIASKDGKKLYVTVGSNSNVAENGIAAEQGRAAIWEVDLVPDYMTSVRDGGFYGWPYSWYGQHVDERVKPQRPDLVAKALVPDYALGPHTASLGLANSTGTSLPTQFANGMFVGQHGSWNRQPHSGYKVIFVPFEGGKPSSAKPQDVLTGFLSDKGRAHGRPVAVVLDKTGALLVADDVGNAVWRVTGSR
jgi:glucose/arabinose dehydrogenase